MSLGAWGRVRISPGSRWAAAGAWSASRAPDRDSRRAGHRTVLGARVGVGGGSVRALPGRRGGPVDARRGVRTGTGAGVGRRRAVGRPRVGSGARVRGSSPPRGSLVFRMGGAYRLDLTGAHAGDARPDPCWLVPRRCAGPRGGSSCRWGRRALGRRHRRQPARDLGDRPAGSPTPSEWAPRHCPTHCR